MLRIFIALTLLVSFSTLSAQDVLIDKKGNELPCKLIGADKKYFTYKGFQDPEFTSQKTQISKIKRIRYADGREVKIAPSAAGWFFIGIGPSIPVGSYASISIDNQYAGFAKTGTGLQLEAAFPAFGKKKQWSILCMISGFNNEINDFGKLIWYQSNGNQSSIPGQYYRNKHNNWNVNMLVTGIGYTIPLSWKFSLDQKLGLGLCVAKKNTEHYGFWSSAGGSGPDTFYQYYAYGSVKNNDTLRAQASSLSFVYGTALRFNITRGMALKLGADFQYAAPTFKIYQYLTPNPPSGQAFDPGKAEDIKSKISVIRFNVGICFNLIPKNIDYGIPK